jgi:hypothetical protein
VVVIPELYMDHRCICIETVYRYTRTSSCWLACVVSVVWSGGLGIKCQCSAVGSLKIYVSETGDDSYSIVQKFKLTDVINSQIPQFFRRSETELIELLLNVACKTFFYMNTSKLNASMNKW